MIRDDALDHVCGAEVLVRVGDERSMPSSRLGTESGQEQSPRRGSAHTASEAAPHTPFLYVLCVRMGVRLSTEAVCGGPLSDCGYDWI